MGWGAIKERADGGACEPLTPCSLLPTAMAHERLRTEALSELKDVLSTAALTMNLCRYSSRSDRGYK